MYFSGLCGHKRERERESKSERDKERANKNLKSVKLA